MTVKSEKLTFEGAAKHPKSFVSLDDADHLLSRKADAIYVAAVLAAWAGRYLGADTDSEGAVLVAEPVGFGLKIAAKTQLAGDGGR